MSAVAPTGIEYATATGLASSPFTPDSKPGSGSAFGPPPGGTTTPSVPLGPWSGVDASSGDDALPGEEASSEGDEPPDDARPASAWGALGVTLPSVFTTTATRL